MIRISQRTEVRFRCVCGQTHIQNKILERHHFRVAFYWLFIDLSKAFRRLGGSEAKLRLMNPREAGSDPSRDGRKLTEAYCVEGSVYNRSFGCTSK